MHPSGASGTNVEALLSAVQFRRRACEAIMYVRQGRLQIEAATALTGLKLDCADPTSTLVPSAQFSGGTAESTAEGRQCFKQVPA
eukprot:10750914-Alexandrium_andersonii.AAC.1